VKFCKLALFLALVAACLPVAAQSQNLRLNIPFDFNVAGQTMPAGHYVVKAGGSSSDGWTMSGDHASVLFTTRWVDSPGKAHAPSLVFLRAEGNRYFLVQIWNDQHSGYELWAPHVKPMVVAQGSPYVVVGTE
jgi:hypothetical protein